MKEYRKKQAANRDPLSSTQSQYGSTCDEPIYGHHRASLQRTDNARQLTTHVLVLIRTTHGTLKKCSFTLE